MTHCIYMDIKIKDYEDVKELWNSLSAKDCGGESAMSLYRLRKKKGIGRQMDFAGLCPFMYFPDDEEDVDEEDGLYHISAHTGSHCAWYDMAEILFMWTFWFYLKQEIEMYGIDFEYIITTDGAHDNLTLAGAWQKMLNANEELLKELPKENKNTEDKK